MYPFPKNETEKVRMIKAIPYANLRVSKDTVVCALHWPSGFEEIKVNRKSKPKKTRHRFGQVYHPVKYRHHLRHQDPQKKLV